MNKISKDYLEEIKNNCIDSYQYPLGNFWIYHDKRDNKFYGVKHISGEYYISKGINEFSTIIRVIWNSESKLFVNPSSDSFWN
jgi:hypothetical protein